MWFGAAREESLFLAVPVKVYFTFCAIAIRFSQYQQNILGVEDSGESLAR